MSDEIKIEPEYHFSVCHDSYEFCVEIQYSLNTLHSFIHTWKILKLKIQIFPGWNPSLQSISLFVFDGAHQ